MFWHNNYAPSVQIDSLLSDEDITLNKLMDAEDILQECKSQNKKLIDYLTRADVLEELVNLITEEPSFELEERSRYKYSNVACELLTCDVPILIEKLASNEMLLAKLYSFIDKEEPLNPLLASFFSKTLHALLRRASDQNWISHQFVCLQVLESLKNRKNCVDLLLQHIQTSAIMDLILILLIKIDDNEMRQNIINWLDEQYLVERLVKLLSPSSDPNKHTNASQLLCDIVKSTCIEPEKKPDPIFQTLQSEKTVKLILETILTGEEKVESSIVGGVRLLINLIGQKVNLAAESSETYGVSYNNYIEDEQRDQFALVIIPYLPDFNQLLLDPPEKSSVKTTAGFLEKPFGRTRLYILKLYVSLLSTGNSKIIENFADLNIFNILLDLFFQFQWNNFLHTQVQQCLSLAINCNDSKTNDIYSNIFVKCRYMDRILEGWEDKSNECSGQNKIRSGYMGHLIVMANEIVKHLEENTALGNYLKTNCSAELMQKWESFVASKLNEVNKKQQITLGEPPETYMMSASQNPDEYTSFPQDAFSHELYSNYIEQTTVPVYVDDDYSFQVEKFHDTDGTFQNSLEQLKSQSLNSTDDYEKSEELFNKICDEKKFNESGEEDQWQNSSFVMDKSDWLNEQKSNNSSSSDEDEDKVNDDSVNDMHHNFCLENDDPWDSITSLTASNSVTDIWNVKDVEPVEQTGWANFDNFTSEISTESSFQSKDSNGSKINLSQVPITNENLLVENQIDNRKKAYNEEIIKVIDENKTMTEEINISSNSDDCQNIPSSDNNTNLSLFENRALELKDITSSSQEGPRSSAETLTDDLEITNVTRMTNQTLIEKKE